MKNFLMNQGIVGVVAMFVVSPFFPIVMPLVIASVIGGVVGCLMAAA